jgi:hypothetical protein
MKKSLIISIAITLIAGGSNMISPIEAKDVLFPAKEFKLPEHYKNRALPPIVDNRNKHLRAPLEHLGGSCGFASSIGYAFTYEINCIRDLEANSDDTRYPYIYAYHFYNDGSSSASRYDFIDGYQLAMATGIPNTTVMGGFTAGYPTKWLNGYDKYYHAMQNRVVEYNYFDFNTNDGLQNLKQWIYDHASGTTTGGVANFSVDC